MTNQRYDWTTTTDDLLQGRDLSGQVMLVTGGSAGLGLATARALAAHGAQVIITARDTAKGQRAVATVGETAAKGASVEVRALDLESLASVRACADRLLAEGRPLDVVFCNAGVMACPQRWTPDGFELQLGTNHLGHFVLANRLAPLVAKRRGRFVITSSSAHRLADVDLGDPNFERTAYDPWQAYGRSKTANALYALELDRRLVDLGVRACSLHPGAINTELARHLTPEAMKQMQAIIEAAGGYETVKFKSIPQGAATQVWAGIVAESDEIGGRYCEDCGIAERNDGPNPIGGVRSYALDPARARALWTRTEQWVSERFPLGE
jgi:NAD(P)-dependent dehydrogenase (short-subunit alcohol dehydrogenase family)